LPDSSIGRLNAYSNNQLRQFGRSADIFLAKPGLIAMENWTIRAALQMGDHPELVAFVGGGGKTSLMFALAAELPGRTVITTTTRIFTAQMALAPAVCQVENLDDLGRHLARYGRCLVIGEVEGDKAYGVDPELPARLLARADVDNILVEADGSRMRPVKAPADHEPVMPKATTLLVPLAGLDALENPIDAIAHRPELIHNMLAATPGNSLASPLLTADQRLTPAGLALIMTHPTGGLKHVPSTARIVPWFNKADAKERLRAGQLVAREVLREPRIKRVVIGAAKSRQPVREVHRRVTAVIPAAGESRRMGRNKLLLPWGETTVLEQTLATLAATSVYDRVVVSGHDPAAITARAAAAGARVLHNPDFAIGMLSSVQVAVRQLGPDVEAVLVMLGDQPMVSPEVIDRLIAAYATGPQGLVAPYYQGQRGNPVLIDRRYFDELLALPADSAPRNLLQRHGGDIRKVEIDRPAILHDLDRPEDYERWKP
jgi:molybdenum cofactor cytidylyltransferase